MGYHKHLLHAADAIAVCRLIQMDLKPSSSATACQETDMKVLVAGSILAFGISGFARAEDLTRTVEAGTTTVVHTYLSWDAHCVSNSGVVKVLVKPQHGKLTPQISETKIGQSRFTGSTACAGKPIKGFKVLYRPEDNFHGTDTFTVEATYGSGRSTVDVYMVTVK
jgi:hypothetical protein